MQVLHRQLVMKIRGVDSSGDQLTKPQKTTTLGAVQCTLPGSHNTMTQRVKTGFEKGVSRLVLYKLWKKNEPSARMRESFVKLDQFSIKTLASSNFRATLIVLLLLCTICLLIVIFWSTFKHLGFSEGCLAYEMGGNRWTVPDWWMCLLIPSVFSLLCGAQMASGLYHP